METSASFEARFAPPPCPAGAQLLREWAREKFVGKQVQELFAKVGSFYWQRENFRLTREVKATFTGRLQSERHKLFGRKVERVVRKGGLKLVFDGGLRVCDRLPRTEP